MNQGGENLIGREGMQCRELFQVAEHSAGFRHFRRSAMDDFPFMKDGFQSYHSESRGGLKQGFIGNR